jgi:hypothetical protein
VLWVITILLLIKCKLSKSNKIKDDELLDNNINNTYSIKDIKKACGKKDNVELQKALVGWASVRFDKEIFSILEVSRLVTELEPILKNLNAAMYSDKKFDQYTELLKMVSSANKGNNKNKSDEQIKGLYD